MDSKLPEIPTFNLPSVDQTHSLIEEELEEREDLFFDAFLACYGNICDNEELEQQDRERIRLRGKAISMASLWPLVPPSERENLDKFFRAIFIEGREKYPTIASLFLTLDFFEFFGLALVSLPYLSLEKSYWQAKAKGEGLPCSEIEVKHIIQALKQPHWLYRQGRHNLEEETALLSEVGEGAIPGAATFSNEIALLFDEQELFDIFQFRRVTRQTGWEGEGVGVSIGLRDLALDEATRRLAFFEWLYGTAEEPGELTKAGETLWTAIGEIKSFVKQVAPFIAEPKRKLFEALFEGPFIGVLSNRELSVRRFFLSRGFDPTGFFMGLPEGLTRADFHLPYLVRLMPESAQRFLSFAGVATHEISYNLLKFAGSLYDWDSGLVHTGPLEGFLHATDIFWSGGDQTEELGLEILKGELPQGSFWQTIFKPSASFFVPRLTALNDSFVREEAIRIFQQIGWRFLLTDEFEPNEFAQAMAITQEQLHWQENGQVNYDCGNDVQNRRVNHFLWKAGAAAFWAFHWNHFEEFKKQKPTSLPQDWPHRNLMPPCWPTWQLLRDHFNIEVEYPADLARAMVSESRVYQAVVQTNLEALKRRNLI